MLELTAQPDCEIYYTLDGSDYLFAPDTGAHMIGSKYYEWIESDEYVPYDAGDVLQYKRQRNRISGFCSGI